MPARCLLNGIPVGDDAFADRACQFGDGLFETIAVIDGDPMLWDRHFLRLKSGCERLHLPVPDQAILQQEVSSLAAGHQRAVLKIIISAGSVTRGYARSTELNSTRYLQLNPWPEAPLYAAMAPCRLMRCQTRLGKQPLLAGLKHLNRLEQVLGRRELSEEFDEGLMAGQDGQWVCGTMSNLYLYQEGQWTVPSLTEAGIAGVVRAEFIAQAEAAGDPWSEGTVTDAMLESADAIYISNALLGMRPVSVLDNKIMPAADLADSPAIVARVNALALGGLCA